MDNSLTETLYPLPFRKSESQTLGDHLNHRHSVELVGIKRVGISNFLRFFLNRKEVIKTHVSKTQKHLFIPVDLNNLIEREIFPFWRLTFKRIVDSVENFPFEEKAKKKIAALFANSIQSPDLFLTVDGIRHSLMEMVKADVFPTIFLVRFDRLKEAVTPEFLDNLQGLRDAANQKLSFVFTSFRPLDQLNPVVFKRAALNVFSHLMYLQPAEQKDAEMIFETLKNKYQLNVSDDLSEELIQLSGGHIQYLQLFLIILNEERRNKKIKDEDLMAVILNDERVNLQSEELWESLNKEEQTVMIKIFKEEKPVEEEKKRAAYLWQTGFIKEKNGQTTIFSPLFVNYLKKNGEKELIKNHLTEFTKKEHLLFTLLKNNQGEICERERVVEVVWPEYDEIGVSDWAIDRLVSRVRTKLQRQKSHFKIVTVRTRGYKLEE